VRGQRQGVAEWRRGARFGWLSDEVEALRAPLPVVSLSGCALRWAAGVAAKSGAGERLGVVMAAEPVELRAAVATYLGDPVSIPVALIPLEPCPRPFCGAGAVFDDDGECGYAVRCAACGCALYSRHGEPAAELVARWNAPRAPAAVALPAFLRTLAARSGFAESQQLADAAQLIEQQAAALDGAR